MLCLEMPCFGARASMEENATAKAFLWQGKTLFGRMLAELGAGIDFLVSHPGIDEQRIATLGISMGGTHAWWLAALDPRVATCVQMCCFADLAALIQTGAHDGHGAYMTVPGLLAITSTGTLAGLAAPRPQLVCVGLQDAFTPPDAFEISRAELNAAYQAKGCSEAVHYVVVGNAGHEETAGMRQAALTFLRETIG